MGKSLQCVQEKNHFAVKCMKKRPKKNLYLVENDSVSEDEELHSAGKRQPEKVIKAEMVVKDETLV